MTEKEPKKESEIIALITGSRLQPLTTFEIWAASMLFKLNSSMRYTIRLISHPPAPRLNPVTNPGPGKRHRYNWVQGRNIVAFERNRAYIYIYIYISITWLYSLEKDLLWREMWSNRPVCYENFDIFAPMSLESNSSMLQPNCYNSESAICALVLCVYKLYKQSFSNVEMLQFYSWLRSPILQLKLSEFRIRFWCFINYRNHV